MSQIEINNLDSEASHPTSTGGEYLPSFARLFPSLSVNERANEIYRTETKTAHRALRQILAPLDERYPIGQRFDLAPFVHWKGNALAPMHRWFRYREAYSPELIDQLNLGKRILDPFSGCGSMLIGAAERGKRALGIDLNPIAAFSSKVKLQPLTEGQLEKVRRFIKALPGNLRAFARAPLPDLSISSKVFEPQLLDAVLRARTALEDTFADDPHCRNFTFLGWLAILEPVGSYFKEGNGIKYRNKKRHIGRYENRQDGEWQFARFGSDQRQFFLNAFCSHLEMMVSDARIWSSGSWSEQAIVQGTAFDLTQIVGPRRFDSIIFSPPYANRFDYFESFKVELWFGNFVNSYEELNTLRKASLRSHLNADFKRPADTLAPLEELLALMDRDASSWRMGVADLMRGYFHDLGIVLKQCRNAMKKGRCHVVVGNSAFAGVIIPTDVLTAMVGLDAGFTNVQIVEARHLTVSPQQRNRLSGFEQYMRESIVILE
jgi:hypothetical protein